jgi:prepilin-type N-terminal cleavage/methylation domain-containing protein
MCRGHPDEEAVNVRGFSLIELLVACAILVSIVAAVAALASGLRSTLVRVDAAAQLEPAGRAAVSALLTEVQQAGADAAVADSQLRVARSVARIVPIADLDSNAFVTPGGAIRLTRVSGGAQAVLPLAAPAGTGALMLDTAARCRGGPPACSFAPGVSAVIYNTAAAERVEIRAIGAALIVLERPLATDFPAGSVLAELITTRYGTRRRADGSRQLVRISSGGAEQPMLDNVARFDVATDTVDPLRVGLVTIHLRLEASSASLRGPAGYLFTRPGTALHARYWVPDAELRFAVSPRNPAGE